jgi:hypothetical protein
MEYTKRRLNGCDVHASRTLPAASVKTQCRASICTVSAPAFLNST